MLMPRAIPPFGLLLCGGRSSRMGQDKALLTLDGERLLDRGLRLLREAGCRQVWAAGDYAGVPCLPDAPAWQGRGPLAGIAAALAYAPQASWLVIPVDMPGLESDFSPPRQIRVLSSNVYFRLERNSPLWREFSTAPAIGMHFAGDWPHLKLELWAVPERS